ncbi:MAG: membrane protein insertase YidC [Verrucomicrobiota bacterium]|nr:membrane protein insertase YidC [Verrucomicrobiota bacterium]
MDRKAWIVIVLCCLGLAVNLYFSGKNRETLLEQERERKEAEQAQAAEEKEKGPEGDPQSEETEEPLVTPLEPEPLVEEETPILRSGDVVYTFTTFGGGIKHAEISGQYAVQDKENLVSLNKDEPQPVGRLTSGVDEYLDIVYRHERERDTSNSISFIGQTKGGLIIRKRWTLEEDEVAGQSYRLKLDLEFENHGENPVQLSDYGLFAGSAAPLWKGEWDRHITLFYQKDGDYKKRRVLKFKKGKKPSFKGDGGILGFAGVSNQFFATIIEPETAYDAWIWGDRRAVQFPKIAGGGSGEAIRMGMSLPEETLSVKGDNKESLTFNLYLGPKDNLLLRKIGEDYGEVMNYGMFGWISFVLSWLLNVLFSGLFSKMFDAWGWGFAIVTLTIIIRAVMWPLQNKSTRAMKRMSKLQPEMKELREKYADDPGRMNQEMMKMYREYGINPLGGCLPLLVQIPIFFGFYIMLQYAVELRQQSFLWVEDLALPDTVAYLPFSLPFLGDGVNLLPTVMAVTMVLQMALTPKTGDKMQRRLFMMMPIIFFFFCYNFASALALYWTTSNIFAIVQMLITRRLPEPELKKKGVKKKGFFQRLQERAEVAQKAQKEMRASQMGGPGPRKPKKRGPRTGG